MKIGRHALSIEDCTEYIEYIGFDDIEKGTESLEIYV
jgi:hypothetical protein